jgi:hypothetical protein
MLRILGSPITLGGRPTRREMLRAGGLGLLGLTVPGFLRLPGASAAPSHQPAGRGKAKACILLYLYGGPSQLETFDPKPAAPVEIRGELKAIPSRLSGASLGELLPHTADVLDRVTLVRSVTHPYPIHGVAYALTGVPQIDIPMELNPRDGRHWPFIGSVVDYLDRRGGRRADVPANVALPWPFSSHRTGEVARAGPYAAFLGNAYNPVWTEFRGVATRRTVKTLQEQHLDVAEPYMGIAPEGRFEVASATELPAGVTLDRLDRRRSLLEQFDAARRDSETSLGRYRHMAYDLIGSKKVRKALDLSQEPRPLRESYGMTVFGQAALTARRLVEAGCRFVSVFWDEFGLAGSAWDTHWEHYPRMKNELAPGFDLGFSGLIGDLDQRGLLDETLVLCLSEHGRTPKLASVNGGGRDHWSQAYSVVLAGGGIARGRVIGRTDRIAGTVIDRPVSPKDILATAYHLLGFDLETTLVDRTNRPVSLVPGAAVLADVLA